MRQNENKKVDQTTKKSSRLSRCFIEIEKFNYFTAMLPTLYCNN